MGAPPLGEDRPDRLGPRGVSGARRGQRAGLQKEGSPRPVDGPLHLEGFLEVLLRRASQGDERREARPLEPGPPGSGQRRGSAGSFQDAHRLVPRNLERLPFDLTSHQLRAPALDGGDQHRLGLGVGRIVGVHHSRPARIDHGHAQHRHGRRELRDPAREPIGSGARREHAGHDTPPGRHDLVLRHVEDAVELTREAHRAVLAHRARADRPAAAGARNPQAAGRALDGATHLLRNRLGQDQVSGPRHPGLELGRIGDHVEVLQDLPKPCARLAVCQEAGVGGGRDHEARGHGLGPPAREVAEPGRLAADDVIVLARGLRERHDERGVPALLVEPAEEAPDLILNPVMDAVQLPVAPAREQVERLDLEQGALEKAPQARPDTRVARDQHAQVELELGQELE